MLLGNNPKFVYLPRYPARNCLDYQTKSRGYTSHQAPRQICLLTRHLIKAAWSTIEHIISCVVHQTTNPKPSVHPETQKYYIFNQNYPDKSCLSFQAHIKKVSGLPSDLEEDVFLFSDLARSCMIIQGPGHYFSG